jgi:uncharacterized protein with HEPN domain
MSPRSWQDRIQDILDAINEVLTFTCGMDNKIFRMMPLQFVPLR